MALEPILDVWGVHGEVITMEYNRSAAVIDLFPFFEQMFGMRDDWLGSPPFKRTGGNPNNPEFYFTLEHFLEAFLGSYNPQEIADFLKKHLDLEQPQAASFLDKVLKAERDYHFVYPMTHPSSRAPLPWYFAAIGFQYEKLGLTIPRHLLFKKQPEPKVKISYCNREDHHGKKISTSPLIRGRIPPGNFRSHLLGASPPTLILNPHLGGPKLDYFSFIEHYNLPTDNLEIRKKFT